MKATSSASESKKIVLGLDGGGTNTVCLAMSRFSADDEPAPLARTVVGSTNWNSVGVEIAKTNLRDAIEGTLATCGHARTDVACICLGVSGVDRPDDRLRMQEWLAQILPDVRAMLHNDATIALASGTGGQLYGIVVISGTGMIALGYNQLGERQRSGGWGALLGDAGSGYAIGAAVLRAVTWAADGRGPQTSLTNAVMQTLRLERIEQLVRWTYDDVSWNRIAELSPLAIHEAAKGDAEALRIVRHSTLALALAVESVAHRLGIRQASFPIVLAGGGLRSGILADGLRDRLDKTLPSATVVIPEVEPAMGAALLALQHSKPNDVRE